MLTAKTEIEKSDNETVRRFVEQWWRAMRRDSVRDTEMLAAYLYGAEMTVKAHKLSDELHFLRRVVETRVFELTK